MRDGAGGARSRANWIANLYASVRKPRDPAFAGSSHNCNGWDVPVYSCGWTIDSTRVRWFTNQYPKGAMLSSKGSWSTIFRQYPGGRRHCIQQYRSIHEWEVNHAPAWSRLRLIGLYAGESVICRSLMLSLPIEQQMTGFNNQPSW